MLFATTVAERMRLILRYIYIAWLALISFSSAYVSQEHPFIRILIWNLCRSFSSPSLCCMPCPSYPLMIQTCFMKSKIMNIPSALRSPASCNFLSERFICFGPTDSSSFRLFTSSPCFMSSHQNLYAFRHSPLLPTEPLNVVLFNLMNQVTFCENYK